MSALSDYRSSKDSLRGGSMSDLFVTAHRRRRSIRAAEVRSGSPSILWAVCSAGAVLYGSLIPFSFDWASFDLQNALGRLRFGLGATSTEDIITNIVVYLPLGLSVSLCGLGRATGVARRFGRVLVAVAVGSCVSILAEVIQTGIALRVPSWMDVACNAIGAGIGAVVGLSLHRVGRDVFHKVRQRFVEKPFTTLAPVLAIGLLCHGLLPFSFVTDTDGLHAAFRRARLDITSIRAPYPGQSPFEPLVAQLVGVAWFAFLGFVFLRARREEVRGASNAYFSALRQGCLLVCLIESLQLFTAWHVFDLATIVLRCLAVVFGVWCGLLIDGPERITEKPIAENHVASAQCRADRIVTRRYAVTTVLGALALFQCGVLLIANIDPSLTSLQNFALDRVKWLPMESLWHRSFGHAVAETTSIMITFGVLAITVVLAMSPRYGKRAWLIAGIATLATATLVELLQCLTPTRIPDTTGPVLALITVVVVSRVIGGFPQVPIRGH